MFSDLSLEAEVQRGRARRLTRTMVDEVLGRCRRSLIARTRSKAGKLQQIAQISIANSLPSPSATKRDKVRTNHRFFSGPLECLREFEKTLRLQPD
jgi:hypothetical protein